MLDAPAYCKHIALGFWFAAVLHPGRGKCWPDCAALHAASKVSNACMTVRLPCNLKWLKGSCARQQSQGTDNGNTSHLPPLEMIDEYSLAERPLWALRSQSSWGLLAAALQAVAPGLAQAGCLLPQQPSCRRHQRGLSMAKCPMRKYVSLASSTRCQSRIRPFTALPSALPAAAAAVLPHLTGAILCCPSTSLVPLLCLAAQYAAWLPTLITTTQNHSDKAVPPPNPDPEPYFC